MRYKSMRMGESAWFKHRLTVTGEIDEVVHVSTYESKSFESFSSVDLSEAVTDAGIHAWVSLSHEEHIVKKNRRYLCFDLELHKECVAR